MKVVQNEQGFVLVLAMICMVALTLAGFAAMNNTITEKMIATNDKVHKTTFYEAEGGAALGSELLEQNFNCVDNFSSGTIAPTISTIWVRVLGFGSNNVMAPTITAKLYDPVNNYDAAYSLTGVALSNGVVAAATQDIGYLYYGGTTSVSPGGAIQMAAGYEGKGKSAAQGGVDRLVDIYSQYKGTALSESVVLYRWRHVIGTEGSCIY